MQKRNLWIVRLLIMVFSFGIVIGSNGQDEPSLSYNIAIIIDASGSMRQAIDGELRIDVAKDAIKDLIEELPEDINTSLWAYGHRLSQSDPVASCKDIEEVIPLGVLDVEAFSETVENLKAIGYTPIADTLEQVAESLPPDENNLIVLMSDGLENCDKDPCEVAEALAESDARLIVNTIGFGVNEETRDQLECIADAGRGIYFDAPDSSTLLESFQEASQPQATVTPIATDTPQVTPTLLPTNTIAPTDTPWLTPTLLPVDFVPTDTPWPTPTLVPTNTIAPTDTPWPTPTLLP